MSRTDSPTTEPTSTSAIPPTRGYAVAVLREVDLGPQIRRYMELVESTFEPFEGRWLVHGTTPEVVEGPWDASVVVIEFPSIAAARDWYRSPAYQEIAPLRSEHSDSRAVLLEGVPPGYRGQDTVAALFGV